MKNIEVPKINVKGDGSCFFYALQTSMLGSSASQEDCEVFGQLLRKEIVSYLEMHPDLLSDTAVANFCADLDGVGDLTASDNLIQMQIIFDKFLEHYSKKETYADHFIVKLATQMLGVNIVIVSNDRDIVINSPDKPCDLTYYLYLQGEHYQSIPMTTDLYELLQFTENFPGQVSGDGALMDFLRPVLVEA